MASRSRRLLTATALLALGVAVILGVAAMTVALPAVLGILALVGLVAAWGLRARPRRSPFVGQFEAHDIPAGAPTPTTTHPRRWTTRWDTTPPTGALGLTRDQLRPVLADWGLASEDSEPTLVVVTELLSNALEHASTPIALTVALIDDRVRVEVNDAAAEPPRRQPDDPSQHRGRGLQLVEKLSSQWGWTSEATGKSVWADVTTEWPV
jgi:anti-sigma regulatory factor (Ser/Thr protein kinase)